MSWVKENSGKYRINDSMIDGPWRVWHDGDKRWRDDDYFKRKGGPYWICSDGKKWFGNKIMESL